MSFYCFLLSQLDTEGGMTAALQSRVPFCDVSTTPLEVESFPLVLSTLVAARSEKHPYVLWGALGRVTRVLLSSTWDEIRNVNSLQLTAEQGQKVGTASGDISVLAICPLRACPDLVFVLPALSHALFYLVRRSACLCCPPRSPFFAVFQHLLCVIRHPPQYFHLPSPLFFRSGVPLSFRLWIPTVAGCPLPLPHLQAIPCRPAT